VDLTATRREFSWSAAGDQNRVGKIVADRELLNAT
jgi:hypothetical protein